jgi:hypothetical protein
VRAELHADGGASAAGDDFFRSREFLAAEGATHTLAAGPALIPVIVREIPDANGLADAISPYGYPGATIEGGADPLEASAVDWSPTGLVSLFLRDRVGGVPAFAGGTERSVVQVHDPARRRELRSRLAQQIRSNERAGWAVTATPGPRTTDEARLTFHALYQQTMRRTEAAERYFFGSPYFDGVLAGEGTWLLEASARGRTGAGAIAVRSDGLLHYYLGGTADASLDASPFKNVLAAMLDLADELAIPLNLGGGLAPGDGLESFKRGFANAVLPFITHEIVCDAEAYERLAPRAVRGGFFPAYRAP